MEACVPARERLFILQAKGSRLCDLGGKLGWSGRHPMNGIVLSAMKHRTQRSVVKRLPLSWWVSVSFSLRVRQASDVARRAQRSSLRQGKASPPHDELENGPLCSDAWRRIDCSCSPHPPRCARDSAGDTDNRSGGRRAVRALGRAWFARTPPPRRRGANLDSSLLRAAHASGERLDGAGHRQV